MRPSQICLHHVTSGTGGDLRNQNWFNSNNNLKYKSCSKSNWKVEIVNWLKVQHFSGIYKEFQIKVYKTLKPSEFYFFPFYFFFWDKSDDCHQELFFLTLFAFCLYWIYLFIRTIQTNGFVQKNTYLFTWTI